MYDLTRQGFEILDKLGEGGAGAVYRARQISLDRLVAVKLLPAQRGRLGDTIERFMIEARIAASLKHPNIVQVYEAGPFDGGYFFAMELVTGYSVADWLQRKGRLSEEDALLIARYVSDALQYAWDSARILHGDVKPANIMVDGDGTIKLADFLALTPPGGAQRPSSLRSHIIGTPNYISPEQALGRDTLDFHTDIYSLGALLYHLVTGVMPFEQEENIQDLMRKQIVEQLPDPLDLNPGISPGCAWLIEKMMLKRSEDRYASWEEARQDIQRVKQGGLPAEPLPKHNESTVGRSRMRDQAAPVPPVPVVPPEARTECAIPSRASRRWMLPAALLLACVCAAGWWHLRRNAREYAPAEVLEEVVPESPAPPPEVPEPPETPDETPELDIPWPPIEAPPPVRPAASPPDEVAPPQVEDRAWQRDYLVVFQALLPLLRARNYEAACALLDESSRAPGLAESCGTDKLRVQRLQALFLLPLTSKDQLKGEMVEIKNQPPGILADIQGDTLYLRRANSAGVQATLPVPFASLSDKSLLPLIRRADPEHADYHEVLLAIAKLNLEKAAMLAGQKDSLRERAELTAWIGEWHNRLFNLGASEALDRLRAGLSRLPPEESMRLLDEALARYGDSDMFAWMRADDLADFQNALDDMLAAAEQPEAPEPELLPAPPPSFELLPEPAGDPDQRPALEPDEIRENLFQLDGQVIRFQFRNRGDIREISSGVYATDLGGENGRIIAVFSRDALRWIRRQPQGGAGQPRKMAYAIVEGPQNRIRLLGRKKSRAANRPLEFEW